MKSNINNFFYFVLSILGGVQAIQAEISVEFPVEQNHTNAANIYKLYLHEIVLLFNRRIMYINNCFNMLGASLSLLFTNDFFAFLSRCIPFWIALN